MRIARPSPKTVLGGVVVLTIAIVSGCRKDERGAAAVKPEKPLTLAPLASVSAPRPSPPASVAASTPTVPPPRLSAPGSTTGTIACGSVRCRAGAEVCILKDTEWRCVADGDEHRLKPSEWYRCDDRSDCSEPNTTCCSSMGSADHLTYCRDPNGADDDPCGLEACAPGGAPCPKGQSCTDGACRPTTPPGASCMGGARCPAATPVCRWEKGKGSCVARELPNVAAAARDAGTADVSLFECTKPGDCGPGHTCCVDTRDSGGTGSVTRTVCRYGCDDRTFESVCQSAAQCPPFLVTGVDGRLVKQACRPRAASAEHPAWMGRCRP